MDTKRLQELAGVINETYNVDDPCVESRNRGFCYHWLASCKKETADKMSAIVDDALRGFQNE